MDHSNEEPNKRRRDDPRIDKLMADVDALQKEVKENTEVTKQVKEMIGSFKLIAMVAKWLTAIIALAVAVKTGYSSLWGK